MLNLYTDNIQIWASAYKKAGWNVIPGKKKNPKAYFNNAVQYQTNPPSLEQVETWFERADEETQILLLTGKSSGVSVLDIDCHAEGCPAKRREECTCEPESVHELRARFPWAPSSITGSGGYHLFFRYEPKLKNSTGLVHRQLDIRSDGGFIVLPPSRHDVYKAEYMWDDFTPWNKENIEAMPEFPAELLKILKEKPQNDWKDILQGVGQGKRNCSTAAIIGKLVRVFHVDEWDDLYGVIEAWNSRNNPPLSDKELRATFASIVKRDLITRKIYAKR